MIKLTVYLLRLFSGASLLYFFLVLFISGYKTSFLWFWAVAGVLAGLFSILLPAGHNSGKTVLQAVSIGIEVLILSGLFFFIIVESGLFFFSRQKPAPGADYVIILGAHVQGTIPSKTLDTRIQTAAKYLLDNPETLVICSGGRGSGEDISEAQAIADSLADLGIARARILLEENSTNTVENLKFSSTYCNPAADRIVLVTSDFHLFRACRIAKKQGYHNITGLGAKELLITTPGYYIREFFALIKEFFTGNI